MIPVLLKELGSWVINLLGTFNTMQYLRESAIEFLHFVHSCYFWPWNWKYTVTYLGETEFEYNVDATGDLWKLNGVKA